MGLYLHLRQKKMNLLFVISGCNCNRKEREKEERGERERLSWGRAGREGRRG